MLGSFSRAFAALAVLVPSVLGASLQQVTNFGTNPTGVGMYIYVPNNVSKNPDIIVAIHYCQGTAQAYYSGTTYAQLADQHGFIVIYPNALAANGQCWDVHTTATLTHNAGGDSQGIVSMVKYALQKYNGNSQRVFFTGESSGAMMSEVLAGAYPDVFAAGSIYSGEPYGCFAGSSLWNSQCATGQLRKTAQQWGDQVRSGYAGYTGPRPRLQIWHGTIDTTLYYESLVEANKQWSNVFGISFTKNNTNTPQSGYTQMIYGDGKQYVAYSAQGVGHVVPQHESAALDWFGITGTQFPSTGSGNAGGSASSTTLATSVIPTTTPVTRITTAPATTTTASTGGGSVAKYGQCGGQGYTGPTTCAAGSTCTYSNAWYSQCL